MLYGQQKSICDEALMTQPSRKRPKLGDIVEISTTKGLAYAQVTHKHPMYGVLLRVMAGLHISRPESFSALRQAEPQFSTFFPLAAACNHGLARIVVNEPISEHLREFPTFRTSAKGKDGVWGPWWLWDGEREWKVGDLKPGMEALPPRGTINDTLLVERIVSGWRHKDWA